MSQTKAQLVSGTTAQDLTVDNINTTSVNSSQLSSRNKVINGAMQVAQRATSVTGITSGDYYVCDRWKLGYGTAGTWTLSKSTDTPNDFGSSFKFDCTTANGSLSAGSNLQLIQFFEGQNLQDIQKGTSTAKEVTVSFYVKTNKTGTYIVELMDHDNSNRHCSKSYTVSDTNWNRYTLTFPADTTGTLDNDNAKSFEIGFWLVAGGNFQGSSLRQTWGTLSQGSRAVGQVNLADSTSNEWYITGVQLEVGSTATDFEHRSFGEDLSLCQRYFYMHASGEFDLSNTDRCPIGLGYGYTSTSGFVFVTFPTLMRTNPSLYKVVGTDYFNFAYNNNNGYPNDISINRMSSQVCELNFHTGSSWDQNAAGMFRTYNTAARVGFSAEL